MTIGKKKAKSSGVSDASGWQGGDVVSVTTRSSSDDGPSEKLTARFSGEMDSAMKASHLTL